MNTIIQNQTRELVARFTNDQLAHQSVPEAFLAPFTLSEESGKRLDLRDRRCFTIDCDDTKDMDDAISLERTQDGYLLGVYIADVSAYITPGSPMDQEALYRGTSLYLPDRTIPMLPEVLSNGLCSLNPGEDRKVVAIQMHLDHEANVLKYQIGKAWIRSWIKGSYSEVNQILTGTASVRLMDKYAAILDDLKGLAAVTRILRGRRIANGASVSKNDVTKVVFTSKGLDLRVVKHGVAEELIEEAMVLANQTVADYFAEHDIPAPYRIQEVKKTMASYNISISRHAELGLKRYLHFTSPIRRVADLKAHQMLTAYLNGASSEELHERYDGEMAEAAEIATKRSRRANAIQLACTRFCYGQYFLEQPKVYRGHVTGYDRQNHPIINIDPVQVRALGAAAIRTYVGQAVKMLVGMDSKNRLVAYHLVEAA